MRDLLRTIWNILKATDRFFTFIRNAILNTILLICLIVVAVALLTRDSGEEGLNFPDEAILKLNITGNIVEQTRYNDSFATLLSDLDDDEARETALPEILAAIRSAKEDSAIRAILLDTSKMGGAGLNQLTAIGMALKEFQTSGKKVIAAADSYSQGRYYLASWADRVLLNPMGTVNITGFGRYSLYFREALAKLKLKMYIFKVGTYKSAVEPFLRDSMSDADREQSRLWLDALWGDYTSHVTTNRHLSPTALQEYADNMAQQLKTTGGDSAALALQQGLVDTLVTRPQIRRELEKLAGKEAELIPLQEYLASGRVKMENGRGNIAIVVAEGTIVDGKAPAGQIGGDTLAGQLRNLQKKRKIKAVVLRINSGGGSAFASEIIRQQLLELKKRGKKVVVSMGSMAASGGYWIAADADRIIADPATLTGSIGVFGILPNLGDSLGAIGVHSDGVGTTTLASGGNPLLPMSPEMHSIIQQSVDNTYTRFLRVVSGGRHLSMRTVARMAEGRVYAGAQAKQLGLVDELGDLRRAVTVAGELAGVSPRPMWYRRKPTMKEQILQFFGQTRVQLVSLLAGKQLGTMLTRLEEAVPVGGLDAMRDPKGIYSWEPKLLLH